MRVQFGRFESANQPSISHLNDMGENKQLANIFLTAHYCLQTFEKIHGGICMINHYEFFQIFCFNPESCHECILRPSLPPFFPRILNGRLCNSLNFFKFF